MLLDFSPDIVRNEFSTAAHSICALFAMGSMDIWLSGPEHFFHKAKQFGILPWQDDDDEFAAPTDDNRKDGEVKLRPHGHACDRCDAILERNPYDPLPTSWKTNPLKCGVSIRVASPTLSVGRILHHCKDWLGDMPVDWHQIVNIPFNRSMNLWCKFSHHHDDQQFLGTHDTFDDGGWPPKQNSNLPCPSHFSAF